MKGLSNESEKPTSGPTPVTRGALFVFNTLQLLSLGFAARWRSSRQEGGDQKQDPGNREDGPSLLCAQVGNIFFFPRPREFG